jgi:ELWxxDGT repeat protein
MEVGRDRRRDGLVKGISPELNSSLTDLTNVRGALYFAANDQLNGQQLWKSDGTAAGTMMVKDLDTGNTAGSEPSDLTNVNGTLYFDAGLEIGGELFKPDGTGAGTVMVKDIFPGAESSNPTDLTNVDGTLYFEADDGLNGDELWKSTASSTSLPTQILAT